MSDEQKKSSKKKIIIGVVAAVVAVAVLVLILVLCLPKGAPDDPNNPSTPTHTHKMTAVERQEATCTEKGHEAYWKCDDCGKMFSDSEGKSELNSVPEIAAKGHTVPFMTETKQANCTDNGEKSGKCEVCQQTVTEVIPALGHQTGEWQFDAFFHWKECSRCGQSVDMDDHEFSNGKCGVCNFDQNAEVAAELTFELLEDGTWSVSGATNIGIATYVEIPATHEGAKVTVVGEKAFYASGIERVIFRNESVFLDWACFSHCHSLTEVRFDEGVREIARKKHDISEEHWWWDYPDYPFYNSDKIQMVYLGSTVNSLETKLFGGFDVGYNFDGPPNSHEEIHPTFSFERYEVSPDNAKYGTDEHGILYNKQTKVLIFVPYKLTGEVTILTDTEEIREGAFGCISGLTAINLPSGLQKIGAHAFDATGITELVIPDSVTSLGTYNGYMDICCHCANLRKFHVGASVARQQVGSEHGILGIGRYFPRTVTSVTVSASNECYKSQNNCILSKDGEVLYLSNSTGEIPVGVKFLSEYALAFNESLTKITIPQSVVNIGYGAFDGCANLQSVELPSGLAYIDSYAFARTGLTRITFPQSLKQISCWAFQECKDLVSAVFEDPSNWKVYNNGMDSSTAQDVVLSNPSQNAAYLTDTYYDKIWKKVST